MPLMARAPIVVPWYATLRAMTLVRCGWPMARKYWRASFHADSTASEPLVVKKMRLRSAGRQPGQALGQLEGGRVGVVPDREVPQLLGLAGSRLRPAPCVRGPQPRRTGRPEPSR